MSKGFIPIPEQPFFSERCTKCNGCSVRGFTLIEFIIYIGIVSVILSFAVSFNWDIIYGSIKSQSFREVQQNGRFALEKIIRELRTGGQPTDFVVANGTLYLREIALTSDRVEVVDLKIEPIANTYKVKLYLRHFNPGGKSEYEADLTLESTVALLPMTESNQGCWGVNNICDSLCQYSDYGSLTDYYINPDCSDSCAFVGYFYTDPAGICSNDGNGVCYKMNGLSSQFTGCSQGASCDGICSGRCTPCRNLNQTQCSQQQGCYWLLNRCRGTCTSCGSLSSQTSCQNQLGCSWQDTRWYWNLTDLKEGYSSYINCEWYVQ